MKELTCYYRNRWHRTGEHDKCAGAVRFVRWMHQHDSTTGAFKHRRVLNACEKHAPGAYSDKT